MLDAVEESELNRTSANKAAIDRINVPSDLSDIEHLAVLRANHPDSKFKYRVIRGIYSYVKVTIGSLCGTRFKILSKNNKEPWLVTSIGDPEDHEYTFVKAYPNVSNTRHLFRAIKKPNIIVSHNLTHFNIFVSEQDLLDEIQYVFDERLTIEIEKQDQLDAKKKAKKRVNKMKDKIKSKKENN